MKLNRKKINEIVFEDIKHEEEVIESHEDDRSAFNCKACNGEGLAEDSKSLCGSCHGTGKN